MIFYIFRHYDIHFVFTGLTRNSKNVLKSVTDNLEKVKPLLETADRAYENLLNQEYDKFLYLLGKSWHQKKQTSSAIVDSETIREIDDVLEQNETVCAHKLCGAGNGGFFLTFSETDTLKIPFESVKIGVESNGVYGRIV